MSWIWTAVVSAGQGHCSGCSAGPTPTAVQAEGSMGPSHLHRSHVYHTHAYVPFI
jgi:hypothetical protein